MQLGFVSAILPDQDLEEVFAIAADIGYDCVELMCWPPGKAERRYAGVTHIDVTKTGKKEVDKILALSSKYGINISALGYYPNPLSADASERRIYTAHVKKVIRAASKLGLSTVNTFIGRDHTKSVDDNWIGFVKIWTPIIRLATELKINIGIENCPMLFTDDEWPGGKNMATTPAIWKKIWKEIPSKYFGLNYDPSHMIWQHMDYLEPIKRFPNRLHHIHAKDVRIDKEKLNEYGIMSPPNLWHTPKLPGMGDVDWGKFFSELTSSGYTGAVCVEVEDRAFEGSYQKRIAALKQSHTYLRQFVP